MNIDDQAPEEFLAALLRELPHMPLQRVRRVHAEFERKLTALRRSTPGHDEVSYSGPIDMDCPLDQIRFCQQAVEMCSREISLRARRGPKASEKAENKFEHSEDFRTIRFRDKPYVLTSQQAQVVQFLYEASLRGESTVSKDRVLEHIGTPNSRLRDTFRNSVLWGKLIVTGEKRGTIRLSIQVEEQRPR